jgi:cholinesterase
MISLLYPSLLAVCLQVANAEWKVGQAVKTTSGEVTGRASNLFGNSEVSEYLGIPYAAPPVGPLRWESPQPFKGNKSIAATKWGA